MCCFSPIQAPFRLFGFLFAPAQIEVAGTKIFARVEQGSANGGAARQWLAYSMTVATPSDVAMVLPVPVARVAEDALQFVDLSGYPQLFSDLDKLFPEEISGQAKSRSLLPSRGRAPLVVHSVGSFEASYVPNLHDFDRLDARFRIPQTVWDARPEYAGFGFAVFKLKKGKKKNIHPMAFSFETSEPSSIFFPTLHVHDGSLHDSADFDHKLYYQAPTSAQQTLGGKPVQTPWVERSEGTAERAIDADLARGVVDERQAVQRWSLRGTLPNADARVSW